MEKRDIVTKMKLLRDYRNNKISEKEGKVLDVKYLGTLSKSKETPENLLAIYLIIEQHQKDGKVFEVEQYYSEDLQNGDIKFLGGNNKSDGMEKIYLSDKYIDEKETRDYLEEALNEMDKIGELDLAEQEKLEEMAKELGIDIEDIESMAELDLDQKVKDEKDKDKDEEDLDETEQEKDEDELTEKQTEKLTKTSGKQEVNINAKFDTKNTLRKELGLNGEYKSIMVVYSEKLQEIQGKDENINNTPVSFVAIKNDGTAEKLNSLELDTSTGAIPTKESIKIDKDETARQDKKTLSRFKIAGKESFLSVERGQYGEMKVYHEQKTKEENRAVGYQLETNSIKPTTREFRDLQKPGQGKYHIDDVENEFQKHAEHGENELKNKADYDGDKETATHVHEKDGVVEEQEQNDQIYIADEIEEWTKEILKDEDVQNVFTAKEVKEMIENYWQNDKGQMEDLYTVEESKQEFEKIKNNIEKDAGNMRTKTK